MTFNESIIAFWKNYAKFDGKATRSEFWWAQLFYVIVYIGLVMATDSIFELANGLLIMFYVATILPMMSLTCRRFNDVKMPSWIPIFGLSIDNVLTLLDWNSLYMETCSSFDVITIAIGFFIFGICAMPSITNKTPKKDN